MRNSRLNEDDLFLIMSKIADDVCDVSDRVLVDEALACAKSGAYRAAYVMVWLSAAESLKRRFKASASRDHVAQKVSGEIEQKEGQQRSIDGFVLSKSLEYGFIQSHEFNKLEHIYKMRCLYGHPYESAPSSVEVLAAFQQVTEAVLAKPLKLREGYLTSQIRLLTEDHTFLDDTIQSIEPYAEIVFERSDEAKHHWFLQELWQKVESFRGDPAMAIFMRRCRRFSTKFLLLGTERFLSGHTPVDELVKFPFILTGVYSHPDIFVLLDSHSKSIVVGNLLTFGNQNASLFNVLDRLDNKGLLTDRDGERIDETVKKLKPSVLAAKSINPKYYIQKIIDDMKSHNWYIQNPAIDALANSDRAKLESLPSPLLREVGRNVLQCADGKSGSAREVLINMSGYPDQLIFGVFEETLFNDAGSLRMKFSEAHHACQALLSASEGPLKSFVSEISARIKTASWKPGYEDCDVTDYSALLDELAGAGLESRAVFGPIRDALSSRVVSASVKKGRN